MKVKRTIRIFLLAAALLVFACAAGEAGKPTGTVLPIVADENVTRECFFANGTPITILEPKADTSGWVHDAEVQAGLQNGLSPQKKPGTGSVISWEEDGETRYVYVTGNSKVFGGSLNADVEADVEITVRGTDVRKAFPNVSFLFGGGYGGDVAGSVTISLEESQMMYLYGGGYNGSVTGDVTIRSAGTNWSLDIVGGGLASSMTEDAVADVGGSVTMDLKGMTISYTDTLVAGGLAETISGHTAQANVDGDVTLYAEGRNVYQLCGGGEAYRVREDCGYPTANVGGSVSVELYGSRVRFYAEGRTTLLGGVFAGGLGYYGTANVGGSVSVTVGDTVFDENAIGVVLGGMAEGSTAVANVAGDACGRVLPGANPAHVIRGCVTDEDGTADVAGDIIWYYTPRDGMTDY